LPALARLGSGVQAGLARTFDALSEQQYRYLWFGMVFSMAAMQMNIVTRSWLAYDLTGSALMLGLVAAARALPQLLLAPLAGVAADRYDKRQVLLISQIALVGVAFAAAVLVQLDQMTVWLLTLLSLLQGVAFPFTMPVRTALVPDLVRNEQITNAMALDSTGRNINRVLAPAVAGVLIAWNDVVAFYAIAIFYVIAVLTLRGLPKGLVGGAPKKGTFRQMAVGFQYIWSRPELVALIAMAMITVVLGMPFQQLLPVFQVDVLDVGPRQLGFMFTAVGFGAILGSLVAAFISESPQLQRIQVLSGLGFGISLVVFALTTYFPLALLMLCVVGFFSQGYLTINRMLVIERTEREFYGRVMSVYMMTWSIVPLVMLPLGVLVDRFGASATVAVSGALLTLVVAGAALGFSRFYLRKGDQAEPAVQSPALFSSEAGPAGDR
jgi:MFS family permease